MKKMKILTIFFAIFILSIYDGFAGGPQGNSFGFGFIIGDPTGATIKVWTNNVNAFDAYLGSSYFGRYRLGGDYLWHFNAFNSSVVKMYAGPGLTVGFGNGNGFWYKVDHHSFYYWNDDNSIGLAGRVIAGINIIPRKTPIEIFLELGMLIGITPSFGVNYEAALGIRFYP